MMDIYVGDIFGDNIVDILNQNPTAAAEPFMTALPFSDLEAAIGNISVGHIEGSTGGGAPIEPIPDPVGDALQYEKRRVMLGRSESLLTGGLGVLGAAPITRPTLLGRRL
jgi:hypothetical protein